jgi:BirA family biotin operon repressor/biotin-[acetyl-CoA-carboxylase] ligase
MDSEFDPIVLQAAAQVDHVEYHPTLTSTNDYARDATTRLGRHESLLVIADEQTAGRGRGSNRWWTGTGSLAFSLLFDPAERGIARQHCAMISLASAIAIVEAANPRIVPYSAGIHWPNDVYVGRRKLAGILLEVLPDGRHILGIGINVNNSIEAAPEELGELVATILDLSRRRHDRGELLIDLLCSLQLRLVQLATAPEQLGLQANRLCLQHGRPLCVQQGSREFQGRCAGIAADGSLILDTADGRRNIYAGFLKPVRNA